MTSEPPLPGPPETGPGDGLVRTLLRHLLDDASLFPPGNLPMPEAITAHRRHRAAWYHGLTGPFVCPDTRLSELRATLTTAGVTEIDLALVVPSGAAAVAAAVTVADADPRLRLRAVEVPIARGEDPAKAIVDVTTALDAAPLSGAIGYVEVPLPAVANRASASALLGMIDERGYRPKLRTGGVSAEAFPDEVTLAACLTAVVRQWMPFKCTAGLHHAVRHTAADTGFEHHGFLNVLLAVAAAAGGASQPEIAHLLGQRDSWTVAEHVQALSENDISTIRALFASFGTCSTDEPVADLIALGLLTDDTAHGETASRGAR